MRNKKTFTLLLLSCSAFLFFSYRAISGTAVTWNGSSYTVPSVGEENWFGSDKVDGLLIALANHGFQKTGGTFTLTSEVDFGGTAGLTGLYFGTRSANDSTAGVFRLSNAESIGWRNAANGANLLLTVDSSNNLTFNGTSIMSSSGLVPVSSGGTGIASYAVGDLLYATPNSQTLTKLPIGTTDYVLKSNGTVPGYGQIVNASVDNSAAIARSKLATGTADHVVINSGAGAFSSEATLATSRGGTNIASYTTGDLLYASNASTLSKLGIGSAGNILKVSGGLPSWGSAATTAAISIKTADYTVTSSDDVVLVSPTTGTVILALPLSSANSGKVLQLGVSKQKANSALGRISAASGDTLIGTLALASTYPLGSLNGRVSLVADGVNSWHIVNEDVTVAAFAESNTARAIANASAVTAEFLMEDEVYDSHDAYNTTTGLFTVPVAGKYQVSARSVAASATGWQTEEQWSLTLFKNGSQYKKFGSFYAEANFTGTVTANGGVDVTCDKNDTLEVRIYQDNDGSVSLNAAAEDNHISFVRIGN